MASSNRITVSIITVCFNSEKFIKQTIESVVNQRYRDIEYIIVDGNSTDGTRQIIEEYISKYPKLIRLISEYDNGMYEAMNKGIESCNGELVGIINSDDWYEEDAVLQVVESYKSFRQHIHHGFQRTFRKNIEKNVIRTNTSQLTKCMIEHPTCFVPKVIYEKYGTYNTHYKYAADYELMLRMKRSTVEFIALNCVIANFREGGASHTLNATFEVYDIWCAFGIISIPAKFAYKVAYLIKYNVLSLLASKD